MKRRIKQMCAILSVLILTIIAFSPLVGAEFTRQFNPEVSGFGITIGTHDSIMISTDVNGAIGTFKDELTAREIINDKEVTISAIKGTITSTGDGEYHNLTFTEKDGSSLTNRNKAFRFNLYFLSTQDMNVYLNSSSGAIIEPVPSTANGAFNGVDREKLLDQVRIAFLSYSTIYQEIGDNYYVEYSEDPVGAKVYSRAVVPDDPNIEKNYETFNRLGYSGNAANDTILFTTEKEKITKVEVVIWIESEGLDVDLTAMCNMTLSMKFDGVIIEN